MHPSDCCGLQSLVPVAHFKWDKGPRNFLLQAKAALDAFTFHFLFTGRTFWSLFPQDLTFSFSGICHTLKSSNNPCTRLLFFQFTDKQLPMIHCSSAQRHNILPHTESPQCSILADCWEAMEHCFLFPDNSQHCWFKILMAPTGGCAVGKAQAIGVRGQHSLHVRL